MPDEQRSSVKAVVTGFCHGLAAVAAVASVILATLLAQTCWQVSRHDPLDESVLTSMRKVAVANPRDQQLQEQFRDADLWLRTTYFRSQRQLRRGALLLLGSLVVFVLALRLPRYLYWQELTRPVRARVLPVGSGVSVGACLVVLLSVAAAIWGLTSPDPLQRQPAATPEVPPSPASEPVASLHPPVPEVNAASVGWPCFRGRNGNGVASVTRAPVDWDGTSGHRILWKVETPRPGFSSPVVSGNRLFVTGADEDVREIYCYDTASGKLLWEASTDPLGFDEEVPEVNEETGFAAPTAAVDGQRVFAVFATGELVAYDLDGSYLWGTLLGVPENHYGHSSSLLVAGGKLFVQMDDSADARLEAYDGATGKPLWESARQGISWSSPILVETGGRSLLVLTDERVIAGYDTADGKLLWEVEGMGGEMGPSAASADGMVFGANDTAYAVGARLSEDGAKAETVWEYDEILPDTASPLATGPRLYLASSGGTMVCLDAKTGVVVWEHDFDDGFYATPILVGELVYAIDLAGVTHIFKDAAAFQEVAAPALGERVSTTPAFVGERIYIRGDQNLYCIRGETEGTARPERRTSNEQPCNLTP